MEDDHGDSSAPPSPSIPSSGEGYEDGSDLDRYCSANSVLGTASLCSSLDDKSLFLASSPHLRLSNADRAPSDGDDSFFGYGTDDDEIASSNQPQHNSLFLRDEGSPKEKARSSILMNSSVAFGSDDWDEFIMETQESGGLAKPIFLYDDHPALALRSSQIDSSSMKEEQEVHQDQDRLSDKIASDAKLENGGLNAVSLAERVGTDEQERSVSLSGGYKGKEIKPSGGDDNALPSYGESKDYGFEMELKGISIPHKVEQEVISPNEAETHDADNSFDEMVLEMEEILLDSSEHTRKITNTTPQITKFKLRDGSSTASTSGTDDPYPLSTPKNLYKIDSVEIIGAKQLMGDVSFGERLVGVKEYTVYILRVLGGGSQWQVERRYRDFYTLYRNLKQFFHAHGLNLPPQWTNVERESRKVFGNASPSVISERSVLIQSCLQSVLRSNYPFDTPASLITFLTPGGTVPVSGIGAAGISVFKNLFFNPLPHDSNSNASEISQEDSNSASPLGKTVSLVVELRAHKSVRQLLELQHYTCAGCRRPLDGNKTLLKEFAQTVGLSRSSRVCEYTGQLFCATCHTNDAVVLPARVLHRWDFTLYPVSQLAKAYLESIYDKPMLCVSAVNPFLLSKVPALLSIMGIRKRIAGMLPYVTCPFRRSVEKGLGVRRYLLECNDFFALRDLVDLSKGAFAGLPVMVQTVCNRINEHITQQCLVCYDAGVPCAARQSCSDPFSLIFPFQEGEAEKCGSCRSIYHKSCFARLSSCPCGTNRQVGPTQQDLIHGGGSGSSSVGPVNRPSNSSQTSTGFLSDIISRAKPDKIWKPRNHSPIILMGSLPNTSV